MAEAHDSIRFLNDKRRVLVVDDEPVNRELLGIILKDSYDVVFAKMFLLARKADLHFFKFLFCYMTEY